MSLKPVFATTIALVLLSTAAMAQTTPPSAATTAPAAATPTATLPSPAAAPAVSPAVTHSEFQALLKETLNNNPDIIIDAVKRYHEKQREATNKEVEKAIAKYNDELFKNDAVPSIGDAAADITLVEFFDYHCGYCKRMLPTITQLHNEDPKVRISFREFPILSEDSNAASKAALAVYKIDKTKYFAFHTALMNSNGAFSEKTLAELAKKQGIDAKRLKKEMDSPEVTAMLDKNRQIAEELGVRGTPALIVGKQMLPGAVPYEDLKKMVAATRSGTPIAPADTGPAAP